MSTQPDALPFTVEVLDGIGETPVADTYMTHQAAFEGVCDNNPKHNLRAALADVEGAPRLQKIRLVAPGVAEVYCKCTPGKSVMTVTCRYAGRTDKLFAQLNERIKRHLICPTCKAAAAPRQPSMAAPTLTQVPTGEPPPHPLAPYLAAAPPLVNTTQKNDKKVATARNFLQVTPAATAEQVRCAFLRRLGAPDAQEVTAKNVVQAYRTLTGGNTDDTLTRDELEAAKSVRYADASFASWPDAAVEAALRAGLLEISSARGQQIPRNALTYSAASGWSCSFTVEYHVEVVPPMVSQLRLARGALPLAQCDPGRVAQLEKVARMSEATKYTEAKEDKKLALTNACETHRLDQMHEERRSYPAKLPPPDECSLKMPPCMCPYDRGCCRCCDLERDPERANRWIVVAFDDSDVREQPPAYWQDCNPLKLGWGDAPFWEGTEFLNERCNCKGTCVCKSFAVRACILASVRETGALPTFLSVQNVIHKPNLSGQNLGYYRADGKPDNSLIGTMPDGTPRLDWRTEGGVIMRVTHTEDQLLVAFRVQGGMSSVVHALLPLAYEPVLASLLRTTVSTAAYHHSKQAMRESLANYSQSILGEFAQPTADLCASLGITAEGATNLVGQMPSDIGQRRRLAEQLGPHSGVATPAAIAFEATKQRKLQEAVDDAVHREVAGVLSDLVGIVAAREEPGLRASMGKPEVEVDVPLEAQKRARMASDAMDTNHQKRRELVDWLATRQPTLFKAQRPAAASGMSAALAGVKRGRPDWLDGVKRAKCAA